MDKLNKNTVDLCRKLKTASTKNPQCITELRNLQENRPQQVLQMIRALADVEELTLKRVSTTVEEERSRQEQLSHYISREEAATKKRTGFLELPRRLRLLVRCFTGECPAQKCSQDPSCSPRSYVGSTSLLDYVPSPE